MQSKSPFPTHLRLALLFAAAARALAARPRAAAAPANVLFIMADQMRWDTVSEALTPNLFRLAQQGLTLSSTYPATPSCTPARSALLTGLSPWYNGMLGYGDVALRVSYLSRPEPQPPHGFALCCAREPAEEGADPGARHAPTGALGPPRA